MTPKKLKWKKLDAHGPRSIYADPMPFVRFEVDHKDDGKGCFWRGAINYDKVVGKAATEAKAVEACQKVWERFVRKQAKAMLVSAH